MELAVDLSSLALYDVVIYADDSGSMESGGGERIDDLKLIVAKVAEVATLFDDDGIEVGQQGPTAWCSQFWLAMCADGWICVAVVHAVLWCAMSTQVRFINSNVQGNNIK